MTPNFRALVFFGLWVFWWLPFFVFYPKNRAEAERKDNRARWGMILQGVGFFLVSLHSPAFWRTATPLWRVFPGVAFALTGIALSWTSIRHLGRQWRVDAGLNPDHELIRTGPYGIVRHPIYASMLCMFLMCVWLVGSLPAWPIALAFFIAGIEIRVRVEDGLLRDSFGEKFEAWRSQIRAYIPGLR